MQNSIRYDRTGTPGGIPVLLVHGIGHRRQAWGRVPELLVERGYDVIAADLPGHGESPRPSFPDSYGMRSSAEQLSRLCHELGVGKPHVVGNSLGGLMALHMSALGTARSALAISPAGFYPPHHLAVVGPELIFLKMGAFLPTALYRRMVDSPRIRRLILSILYRHPETLSTQDCVDEALSLRHSKGFWPHFLRATLHRFTRQPVVPTVVAWGDHDRMLLPSQAETVRRRFRDNALVSVVPLPDAGHCGQVDQPELVVQLLERLVERTEADGTSSGPTTTTTPAPASRSAQPATSAA